MKKGTPQIFPFSSGGWDCAHLAPWLAAALVFAIYLSTVCPAVYLGDSGELTTAAFSLGVAHNSGYPLYVLLGKAFSFLPFGTIAFRINLMASVFAALTVWLIVSVTLDMTRSVLAAVVGALLLAFTPLFWTQSTVSEVYSLHTFFVAALFKLLWRWDEERTFKGLALLVFITGLSFGNHMQTVMLAPAVLFLLLSRGGWSLFSPGRFCLLSFFFLLALGVYLLLPVRTNAGAAIHWGDPDTLERFWAHVTGHAHRSSYVFTKDAPQYWGRAKELISVLAVQFGATLALTVVGWVRALSPRWRVFFAAVVSCDLFYGIFLNIISPEITPFGLPSCVVLAILAGTGIASTMAWMRRSQRWAGTARTALGAAFCLMPGVSLGLHYDLCDQSRNYLAQEHTANVFSSVKNDGVLFLDGDNNIFPVMYGRLVEGMREDVTLYDRPNLFFRRNKTGPPETDRGQIDAFDKNLVQAGTKEVYYAVFNPAAVPLPTGYALEPRGILYHAVPAGGCLSSDSGTDLWPFYVQASLEDSFHRDFMTRQVSAYYRFALGRHLLETGEREKGLQSLALASTIGYDDETIHLDLAELLIEKGYYPQARFELERALTYHEDLSGVYNNWGYWHYQQGQYQEAVSFYQKALSLKPGDYGYHNNLGLALLNGGDKDEAQKAFHRSVALEPNQPDLLRFLAEQGIATEDPV